MKFKNEVNQYKVLMSSIPAMYFALYAVAVVLMNLLANCELVNIGWLALDCGFVVSWVAFLAMDMLTRRFGAKASIEISITTEVINLVLCGLLFVIMKLHQGNWGAYWDYGESSEINQALDATFGGTWYVVLGSAAAFIVSSIVNSLLNQGLGKLLKKSSFKAFAIRSWISTAIGQLVDNLIFASLVSYVFFGWSLKQVIMCSVVGACAELLAEVVFSPLGYKICKKWEENDIGNEYVNTYIRNS